ncbi:iron ABC transporter permease, partial [bacterium]|nr:iron ABC transporter permease [bacterium]MBU1024748.1 iron ABC transporter permease [bacterium]
MILLAFISLMVGSHFYAPSVLIETLRGDGESTARTIIWSLRFPRMIMAFEVGAALALAGLALQSLLKNPLVEPYLIGASSGAAFGATLILVFFPVLMGVFAIEAESMSAAIGIRSLISIAAFLGALVAISFLYISSYKKGDFSTKRLILMGVVLGAFLSAFVALMIIASGESIRQVVWWLMGSLEIGPRNGWIILGVVLIIFWIYLFTKSYKLNLLSQGEETALGLG